MKYLQIFPAYGRKYSSADAILADLLAGRDFSLTKTGGPYFSIRDLAEPMFLDIDGFIVFTTDIPVMVPMGMLTNHVAA